MSGIMQPQIQGFLFSDRGEFVAKGFEEPVRVYEVRWRE
jgi:class 3 adenylate cyclase